MKKLKIYLDTSVINFLFADDTPDFKKITEDFFKEYFGRYDIFVSDIVLLEINKTVDQQQKSRLLSVIDDYPFKILEIANNEAIGYLSELYIKEGVIPQKKKEDALHIAVATVYEMDILLSWNFKHLANIKKQININAINEKEGYLKKLSLLSPLEVEYEDE
ncbi:MAG: type II toxin-antitoxin system VapC family toxin [Candidatus Aminicenantes bacterium]